MERRLRRARRDEKNARHSVNPRKTAGPTAGSFGRAQTKRDLKMNGKKYELTDKTKTLSDGTVLYRIRAARKFTIHDEITVRNGDLGGWIERENNLSHDGSAWVYGEAYVYGKARVFDDACVYGNARVSGHARIYGNARVYEDARVYGKARVFDDARVFIKAEIYGKAEVYGKA